MPCSCQKWKGTKHFQHSGKSKFGWDTIDDMYKRELVRVQQNCTRMVPWLKETHCLQDAWTKLNVLPAKTMQVSIVYVKSIQMYIIARTGFR